MKRSRSEESASEKEDQPGEEIRYLQKAISSGNKEKFDYFISFFTKIPDEVFYEAIRQRNSHKDLGLYFIKRIVESGANMNVIGDKQSSPMRMILEQCNDLELQTVCEAQKTHCQQKHSDYNETMTSAFQFALKSRMNISVKKIMILMKSGIVLSQMELLSNVLRSEFDVKQKIAYLDSQGLDYRQQVKLSGLQDYCADLNDGKNTDIGKTILGLAINSDIFSVVEKCIMALKENGVKLQDIFYQRLLNYALEYAKSDDHIRKIFQLHPNIPINDTGVCLLAKRSWPVDQIITAINGKPVTCNFLRQYIDDLSDDFSLETIDDYLSELIKKLGIHNLLPKELSQNQVIKQLLLDPKDFSGDGYEFIIRTASSMTDKYDGMQNFKAKINLICATAIAGLPKTLHQLLSVYKGAAEQVVKLTHGNDSGTIPLTVLTAAKNHYQCVFVLAQQGASLRAFSDRLLDSLGLEDEIKNQIINIQFIQDINFNLAALSNACPTGPAQKKRYTALLEKIASFRESVFTVSLADKSEVRNAIKRYHGNDIRYINTNEFNLLRLAHQHLQIHEIKSSNILITANGKTNDTYLNEPWYCCYNETYYSLPGDMSNDRAIEKTTLCLLTKFTYHVNLIKLTSIEDIKKRNDKLKVMYEILMRLNKTLKDKTLLQLHQFQEEQEYQLKDFFGEDISEDSDEVTAKLYQQKMPTEKRMLREHTKELLKMAESDKLLYTEDCDKPLTWRNKALRKRKKGDLKLMFDHDDKGVIAASKDDDKRPKLVSGSDILSPHQRAIVASQINFDDYNLAVLKREDGKKFDSNHVFRAFAESSLSELNRMINAGKIADVPNHIRAPFSIALARGVHYATTDWTADTRRKHRSLDEVGQPHFAAAVFKQQQQTFEKDFQADQQVQAAMLKAGKALAEKLLDLKVESQREGTMHMFYAGLQQFYTGSYDKFHEFLKVAMADLAFTEAKDKQIAEILKKTLFNDSNPMLSTADTPYHALKYAYGLKSYPGQFHTRLRPRYRADGVAERNKSGKVYIYLMTLNQYLELNPNHVTSMADMGDMGVQKTIIPERETSFYGYIPQGCIELQHVAKYPSFQGDYRPHYFHKYGLDEKLYTLFKTEFAKSKPHSPERRSVKLLLGEWLCAYHEVRLMREVVSQVVEQGRILIFRDLSGEFRFTPPDVRTHNKALEELRQKNPATDAWRKSMSDFLQRGQSLIK